MASPTHVSPALTRRRAAARAASAEGVVKSLHFGQIKGCVGGGMARETSSEEDDEVEFRGAFRRGAQKAGSGAGDPDGTVEVTKGESGGKRLTGGGATGMSSSMLRQVMGLKAGQFQADVGQWDSEESLVLAKQQAQLLRTKEVGVSLSVCVSCATLCFCDSFACKESVARGRARPPRGFNCGQRLLPWMRGMH